ncbi:hypothetical protein [Streptomyces sp. NPDC029554]|uniref:hypothetical protein n=1 Tax=Streptomyces sp. NPDC029554 TaxID=3155126 RepID=UPI0033E815C4
MLLAAAGIVLLRGSNSAEPPSRPSTTPAAPAVTATRDGQLGWSASGRVPAGGSSPQAAALPPHGEGAAGDQSVQRSLEEAWPADLPTDDERELRKAGRALLRADATGIGREEWPSVFGDSGQAVAPAFAAAGFRVQAVVARRHGSPSKAVVHLVWAGRDRGGTFTDGRITDWFFTRTIQKGAATWMPQPRM